MCIRLKFHKYRSFIILKLFDKLFTFCYTIADKRQDAPLILAFVTLILPPTFDDFKYPN